MSAPLALVACGDDDSAGRLADAPPQADARVEPDTTVTLTVTYDGTPRAGVHTYFLAPDNTVVATVDTDATGVASAKMPNGGSVTAIDPFPRRVAVRVTGPGRAAAVEVGNNDLRSFVGVKGGDHLTLTDWAYQGGGAFQIYAPRPTGSANSYNVFPSCGTGNIYPGGGGSGSGSSDPGGYLYPERCNGKLDLIIVAYAYGDNEQLNPIGVLFKTDVALKDGEVIDLRNEQYTAPTERTFAYLNSPGQVQLNHSLVTSKGLFGPFQPTVGFDAETTLGEPTIAGATGVVDSSVQTNSSVHHVVDAGALTASYTLDFANLLLRGLTSLGDYDIANKKLTWTEEETGATPDFTIAWFRTYASSNERTWDWTVVAPYTRGVVVPPVLPTDVATWAPADGDSVTVSSVVNVKATGGYDAARAHALDAYVAADRQGYASYAVPSGRVVTAQYVSLGVTRSTAKTAAPATKR